MLKGLVLALLTLFSMNLFAEGGSTAIRDAASENKHLFIFFYKDHKEKTANLEKVFDQTVQQLGGQIKWIKINANDPTEKALAERFSLKRSPMPFVAVLAPNGAITGGFFAFNPQQLKNAISSPGAAACLKALQDRKLVLLCLQNRQTAYNAEALRGVNDFRADPRYANATEVVMIDPADRNETTFLNQLGADLNSSQALTLLISPPAEVVATYTGPTRKEEFVSSLQSATSGCCPGGCCPGGCCPGGKCGK